MKKIVFSTISILAISSTSFFATDTSIFYKDNLHSIKLTEKKIFYVVDNKNLPETIRNNTNNHEGSYDGDKDDKKMPNDDYEPQCKTLNWAMCTRRKKKHDDD